MKNEELIKALRCCIVDFNSTQSRRCNECPYGIYADGNKACENKAKRDAADALEAADKRIAELEAQLPKGGAKMDAESEADADYQASVLMQEYFERYEPTYNSEDGSM